MNGVSDVKLAVACYNAGILPSLVPYCYATNGKLDINLFEQALIEYSTLTNNGPLLVALEINEYKDTTIFNLLVKHNVRMVEVLDTYEETYQQIYNQSLVAKQHNIITVPKVTGGFQKVYSMMKNIGTFDCISLKGPKGAGRGDDSIILEDEVVKIKNIYPNLKLIVSGGINTNLDIQHFKQLGADYFSIGTIFSASTESSVNLIVKEKMVKSSKKDTHRLDTGARQNSLVFTTVEEVDDNNTRGLLYGVRTGTQGHIFVGTGIDHINSIRDVKDIVEDLVKGL